MRKKLILTALSLALITGFFCLPANHSWVRSRIFPYYNELPTQWRHQSIEERKDRRWRPDYKYAKEISKLADSISRGRGGLVLIPPAKYFRDGGIDFHVPEPAVFYYYTGLKTTCAHCDSANAAKYYIRVNKKHLLIQEVPDPETFQTIIDSLKKYKPEL